MSRVIVFCVRERVRGGPTVIAHLAGRHVAVLRDHGPCVPLLTPRPAAETMAVLERQLCDQHGRPVLEVD